MDDDGRLVDGLEIVSLEKSETVRVYWNLHYRVKHDWRGHCAESDDCPGEGWLLTIEGPALADDPNRQWTTDEIDRGLPWRNRV